MQRGSKSVAEFSWLFKGLYDQLAVIDRPINDLDKVHCFLGAVGPNYKIFSTTMLSQFSLPSFADIIPKALSHKIFERSVSTIYQLGVLCSATFFHQIEKHQESQNLPLPLPQNCPIFLQFIVNSATMRDTWLNIARNFLISRKSSMSTLLRHSLLVQTRTPTTLSGTRTLVPPLTWQMILRV